jgi:hypothetical protein
MSFLFAKQRSLITKQLLINSLEIPDVIKEEVKSYIFVDIIYVNSRRMKNEFIICMWLYSRYHPGEEMKGSTGISYSFKAIIKLRKSGIL